MRPAVEVLIDFRVLIQLLQSVECMHDGHPEEQEPTLHTTILVLSSQYNFPKSGFLTDAIASSSKKLEH